MNQELFEKFIEAVKDVPSSLCGASPEDAYVRRLDWLNRQRAVAETELSKLTETGEINWATEGGSNVSTL